MAETILFIFAALIFLIVGFSIGKRMTIRIANERVRAIQQDSINKLILAQHAAEDKIPEIRKEAKQEALRHSRAGIGGIVAEEVAPLMPNFPGKASEARFIGKPIDYVIFTGMDEKNITEVVFVEVKSGNSQLNQDEKTLRDTIVAKNVRWAEFHIPDGTLRREDIMSVPAPPK